MDCPGIDLECFCVASCLCHHLSMHSTSVFILLLLVKLETWADISCLHYMCCFWLVADALQYVTVTWPHQCSMSMSLFVQNTPSLLQRVPRNFALIGAPEHPVECLYTVHRFLWMTLSSNLKRCCLGVSFFCPDFKAKSHRCQELDFTAEIRRSRSLAFR
jgi:hypothetical protein